MPRYEIYCAGHPSIATAPALGGLIEDPAQPPKQKLPNRPNLAEPHLNHQLTGPRSPQTRSANLGFEIRGSSCPSEPGIPSPQQTIHPPAPIHAGPAAKARPPSQTAKIERPNKPNFAEPFPHRRTVLARNRLHISPGLCYTLSGSRSRASQEGLAKAAPSQLHLCTQEPVVRRLSLPGPVGILG